MLRDGDVSDKNEIGNHPSHFTSPTLGTTALINEQDPRLSIVNCYLSEMKKIR